MDGRTGLKDEEFSWLSYIKLSKAQAAPKALFENQNTVRAAYRSNLGRGHTPMHKLGWNCIWHTSLSVFVRQKLNSIQLFSDEFGRVASIKRQTVCAFPPLGQSSPLALSFYQQLWTSIGSIRNSLTQNPSVSKALMGRFHIAVILVFYH